MECNHAVELEGVCEIRVAQNVSRSGGAVVLQMWPDFVPCVDVFESRTINSHTLWICRGSSYRSHILSLIHLAGYHTSANGLPVEVSGFPNNVSSPPPWPSFLILRFVRWAVASCAASCLFCAYCCCLGLRPCKIVPQTQDTVPFLVCLAHERHSADASPCRVSSTM